MNSGANPHPRWRRRHHRISDPTQPRTLNHTQILPATTDNPAPPVAGLTPARYRSLPLTTRPAAANPVPAALGFAKEYGVPLLIVLCDNEQYASQTWNVLKYYPNSEAVRDDNFVGNVIAPTPDYVKIAEAYGGAGERVQKSDALLPALRRAVDTVASGQTFLLDVIVNP